MPKAINFVVAFLLASSVTTLPSLALDAQTEEQYLDGIYRVYKCVSGKQSALQLQSWLLDPQIKKVSAEDLNIKANQCSKGLASLTASAVYLLAADAYARSNNAKDYRTAMENAYALASKLTQAEKLYFCKDLLDYRVLGTDPLKNTKEHSLSLMFARRLVGSEPLTPDELELLRLDCQLRLASYSKEAVLAPLEEQKNALKSRIDQSLDTKVLEARIGAAEALKAGDYSKAELLANENLDVLTKEYGNYSVKLFPEHCIKLQVLLQTDKSRALELLDFLNSVVDKQASSIVPTESDQTFKTAIDSLIGATKASRKNPEVALRAAAIIYKLRIESGLPLSPGQAIDSFANTLERVPVSRSQIRKFLVASADYLDSVVPDFNSNGTIELTSARLRARANKFK